MTIKLYTVRAYTGAWYRGVEINKGYDVLASSKDDAIEEARKRHIAPGIGNLGFTVDELKAEWGNMARIDVYISPWEKVRHEDAAMMEAGCYPYA